MSSDEVVAHVEAQSSNKKQDDFDMAKLKKSLKQEHKRSSVSKNKVAKLTPAEIRSLNHSAGVSKSSSLRSIDNHSLRGLASRTPPLTPDNLSLSHQSASRRRGSNDLPTPPQSPGRERRASTSSTRHIHAPKPISHVKSSTLVNSNPVSRPASANSYRGIETYRGPEITRNGSLTMLQRPSQQIVSNPLSQFSRPRQSTLNSSPQKPGTEPRASEDTVGFNHVKDRHQSLGAVSQNASRGHSPVRKSDSPVSLEDGKAPETGKLSEPVGMVSDGPGFVPVIHVTPRVDNGGGPVIPVNPVEPLTQQKQARRKSGTASLDGDEEPTPLRKEYRRRTLMSPKHGYCLHAIHYADTKPGMPPQMRDSLREDLPSAKTSLFKDELARQATAETESGQHPAVRPLSGNFGNGMHSDTSSSANSSQKGKERDLDAYPDGDTDAISITSSVPSYSRCSCCGRIQKPGGFESDLSPVLENEYLRTNMNFEVERTNPNHRRNSSSQSTGPRKYIPIIPMEVGNETKQARIEPMQVKPVKSDPVPTTQVVAVNKLGDLIGPSSMPLAIMPKQKGAPRFTRFGSLHAKKEDSKDASNEPEQQSAQNLTATHQIQRFGSLYGMRNDFQAQGQNSTTGQAPAPNQSAYQAQQARQYPQVNGHRPTRSSRLAYQESLQPEEETSAFQQVLPVQRSDTVERHQSGSPVASQEKLSTNNADDFLDDDDDDMMVDLSSFDGHFVHQSIARSVSVLRDSPPTTRDGKVNAQLTPNNHESASRNSVSSASSGGSLTEVSQQTPKPSKISTDFSTFHHESTMSRDVIATALSDPNPLSAGLAGQSSDSIASASAVTSPGNLATPIDTTMLNATSTTMYRPGTTMVKIIPSAPVSSSSSQKSGTGPLRLGDWVLPETPTVATASG